MKEYTMYILSGERWTNDNCGEYTEFEDWYETFKEAESLFDAYRDSDKYGHVRYCVLIKTTIINEYDDEWDRHEICGFSKINGLEEW